MTMLRSVALTCVLSLVPSLSSAAQEGTAVVRGTIADATGASVAGAQVAIFGVESGIRRETVTALDGSFALLRLLPGPYTLSVVHEGFDTVDVRDLRLRSDAALVLTIRLRVRPVAERVRVVGREGWVRNGEGGSFIAYGGLVEAVRISGDSARVLPLSARRDWSDSLSLAPGIVVGLDASGLPRYHWHGSDTVSHLFRIDGADMGAAVSSDTAYINLSPEAIEHIDLRSAAQDAAMPLGLGAMIDVSSRSNGSRRAASVTLIYQPHAWNAQNQVNGTSQSTALGHVELSAGGPAASSRVWLFGAAHQTRRRTGISRRDDQLAALRTVAPGFEPFDNSNRAAAVFGKITARVGSHDLLGLATYDRRPEGANGPPNAGAFARRVFGGHGGAARLSSAWSARFSSEVGIAVNDTSAPLQATRDDQPSRPVHLSVVRSGHALIGTGAVALLDHVVGDTDRPRDKMTITVDTAYRLDSRVGAHDVRAGGYLQPLLRDRLQRRFVNGGFALDEVVLGTTSRPAAGTIPFHPQTTFGRTEQTVAMEARDHALYVQDTWRPAPRLTIDLGLRADFVARTDGPADPSTRGYVEFQRLMRRATDGEIRRDGVWLAQRTAALGPRFTLAFAPDDGRRHTLRASWGRIHESLSASQPLATVDEAIVADEYDPDLDGTLELRTLNRPPAGAVRTANPARRQPRVDEWTVAYQWQPLTATAVNVGVTRRAYRDRFTVIETNARYVNGQFIGYADQAFNQVYRIDNNVWNWPVYVGAELQARTYRGPVSAALGYTRQWRRLHGGWQPNDPAAILQPQAFPNHRGLGALANLANSESNSLSGVNMTTGSQWRDHVLHVSAQWLLPAGFAVASTYTFQSGPWSGPLVQRLSAESITHQPVRTVSGQLLANPLATPFRFAHQTRGDGQLALPAMQAWNVRLAHHTRRRPWGLEIALELFNLTNHDADLMFESGANQLFSPNFTKGTVRQPPRAAQVELRVTF